MRRRLGISLLALMFPVLCCHAAFVSINIDKKTIAAMKGAYTVQLSIEDKAFEDLDKILKHYTEAEVASAGIFASKWLDREALQNAGLFESAEENYYYRRIYTLVSARIMPKIVEVASLMAKHPDKAIYWGPYLYRVCEQTRQLCMIFESVVSNGKCSFQDIAFLTLSDEVRQFFDLLQLGDVDWASMWDKLADFGSGISREDLMEDLEGLLTAGQSIASAGYGSLTDAWATGSKSGSIFSSKPGEIVELYQQFRDIYGTYSDPVAIKNELLSRIGSTDSIDVSRLFSFSGYNITNYLSDYLSEMVGSYYTQRWYIYSGERGGEYVCDYQPSPLTNTESMSSVSGEWYCAYVPVADATYTSADYEASLRNSENYAGWSRSKCESLNGSGGKYHYTFSSQINSHRLLGYKSSDTKAMAYAHNIQVYKWWAEEEDVYEELFDSQYDSEAAIEARFAAKLKEYNDNEDGKVYYIGKDEKHYYTAADNSKLHNCSSVSFTRKCHDSTTLGEGTFQWKENGDQRHALNEDSKRYAMESTLPEMPDLSDADAKIQELSATVSTLSSRISTLESENNSLLAQISRASVEDAAELRAQYNANLSELNTLKPQLSTAKSELGQWTSVRNETLTDYSEELDGVYRIPALMHDLEDAYSIVWTGNGSWSGFSYIRRGNLPNIDGVVTFRADLKKARGESWFLGIRYHRCILRVDWTLSADYDSNEIVDVMTISSDSDEEKNKVNKRLSELQRESPQCEIELSYAYSNPADSTLKEEDKHLLWMSDRIRIARDVDYRLSKIHTQLLNLERYLRTRESLLDYLKRSLGIMGLNDAGKAYYSNKSFKRWRRSAKAAASGESISSVLSAMDEE